MTTYTSILALLLTATAHIAITAEPLLAAQAPETPSIYRGSGR